MIRNMPGAVGHLQPATPSKNDTTVAAFVNDALKKKRSNYEMSDTIG